MKYLPYLLIAVLAFGLGRCSRSPAKSKFGIADTVTSLHVITKVDVDTQYILFPVPYLAWIDNSDTIHVSDTCWHMREYKEFQDSNYYAKISGVAPRLDEIRVYPKTVTQYVYRDRIVSNKEKRWGLGLTAGYGYPYGIFVGIGVSYNFLQW